MNKNAMISAANSLVAGAHIIMNSCGVKYDGHKRYPSLPVILVSAFSIEVSLKFLLGEGNFKRSHNLYDLFEKLSVDIREPILDLFIERDPKFTKEEAVEKLEGHQDVFVKWRYAFEKDEELSCSPDFLFSMAGCLVDYIEQSYDYEKTAHAWKA